MSLGGNTRGVIKRGATDSEVMMGLKVELYPPWFDLSQMIGISSSSMVIDTVAPRGIKKALGISGHPPAKKWGQN